MSEFALRTGLHGLKNRKSYNSKRYLYETFKNFWSIRSQDASYKFIDFVALLGWGKIKTIL